MHTVLAAMTPTRLGLLRDTFELPDAPSMHSLDEFRRHLLTHPADALVADAIVPWLGEWLAEPMTGARPGVLVVAEGGSVGLLPALARAGADAVLTLPASRTAASASLECAVASRSRCAESASELAQARRRLQHLVDLGSDLERERRRGDILATTVVRLERAFSDTCRALAGVAGSKANDLTGSERVARLATMLAGVVAPELAVEPHLALGFLLHDVGEIAVPDHVLLKPDSLTEVELAAVRAHPTLGAELVGRAEVLRGVVPIIRHHHERWDGLGYPDRLAGTDIPIGARVFAVADTADAMLTDRPYRAARSVDEVCLELERAAGTQLDPDAVAGFLALAEAGALEPALAS